MLVALDTSAIGPESTGVGRYASTLAHTLPCLDRRRRYVLIAHNGPGKDMADASGRAVPTIPVGSAPHWHHVGLPGELEAWDVDVYHSPLFTCPLVKVCRYVVTLHDVIPLAAPQHCQPAFLRFFERRARPCLELADRVVTVSEYSRRDVITHLSLSPEKIAVVPECVDSGFRPPGPGDEASDVASEYGITSPYILYAGSIEPRKNVDSAVTAYARLPSAFRSEVALVIVGKQQPEGTDVQELARRLGVAERVVLPGYVPDAGLAMLYRRARMFVFPSRYEGFGLPVLEAMASGTPVITSNVTSLPEVAGDAALLVDPDDVEGLAEAMRRVREDKTLRNDLIERGLRRAAMFSPQRVVEQMGALYETLEAA